MKELLLAKTAGYCFGVKRAIDSVSKALDEYDELYSIGQIIHNERVVADLSKKGLIVLNDDEALTLTKKNIIIRSHGIEKEKLIALQNNNNNIIDLTCPFVKRIHNIVSEASNHYDAILVIGNKDHEEVKGIVSYADIDIFVINDEDAINTLKIDQKSRILVVFQTTFNIGYGQKLVAILRNMFYNLTVSNTICNATEERQEETRKLALVSDSFLVIGSNSSSNTQKLYEIAKDNCQNVYLVNGVNDLNNVRIGKNDILGVSAGASVPDYLIQEITDYARTNF